MYANTADDGSLYIPGFFYETDDETDYLYELIMDWKGFDCETLVSEFREFLSDLRAIPVETGKLSGKTQELYNRYIAEFSSENHEKAAVMRIGEGLKVYEMIWYSRVMYKLYVIDAPRPIVENWEKNLAEAVMVHRFAKSLKVIRDYN